MWNILRATTINAKIKRWIGNVVGPQGVGDSVPPKVSFRMKYLFLGISLMFPCDKSKKQ